MGKKKNGAEAAAQANPKKEAFLKAYETLGPKAEVSAYSTYIKDNFGIDVQNKVIGVYLHHLRRERRKQKKAKVAAAASTAPRKPALRSGEVSFEEIRQVKVLVQRHGADRIRDLVELVS